MRKREQSNNLGTPGLQQFSDQKRQFLFRFTLWELLIFFPEEDQVKMVELLCRTLY